MTLDQHSLCRASARPIGWTRVGWTALVIVGALTLTQPAASETFAADTAVVKAWMVADDAGRYMVSGANCADEPLSNWAGASRLSAQMLRRCTYTVESCVNLKGDSLSACLKARTVVGPKKATVVVLEAGLDRFAAWVATACAVAGGGRSKCLRLVYDVGRTESNWQIVLAGIVFEDMAPSCVEYGYAFRDGLTVRADAGCGWPNGSKGEAAPTAAQDAACSRSGAKSQGISPYARPLSTTRSELIAWKPSLASQIPPFAEKYPIMGAAGMAWRSFVRETLFSAAVADENPLVVAKAVALRKAGAF